MSLKKITPYLLLLLFVIQSCQERPEEVKFNIGITNVVVINENGEQLDELQNVFLDGDTIALVEASSSASGAAATTVIDGTDKFLLLGLWDNHAHFRGGEKLISQNEKFLKLFVDHGITTVRDAGGDLTVQVQKWNEEINSNLRIGPTIYTSGPKIDGLNSRWDGSLEVANEADIKKALDSLQELDVDYVKMYDSTISGENYLETIRQASSRGMITSGHMPFTVMLDDAIEAGLDNVEHLYYILKGCSSQEKEITEQIKAGKLGFWGSMEQLIDTYDEDTAQATFKKLRDNNVFVTPTQHIGNILSYLDEVDHSNDAYLQNLSPEFLATYEGRNKSALNASPKAKANRKALQDFFQKLTKSLSEAGVSLLAGSDSGAYNSYTYPGPSLHGELSQMVNAGLTTQEALRTSYNGARFLNKNGYSFARGNTADLLLLKKSPLENIENTLDIDLVIKNGQIVQKN